MNKKQLSEMFDVMTQNMSICAYCAILDQRPIVLSFYPQDGGLEWTLTIPNLCIPCKLNKEIHEGSWKLLNDLNRMVRKMLCNGRKKGSDLK